MSTEKRFNRRRLCGCRSACRNGSQHLQKFFGGAHRKAVMRMSDNIRVDMVSKMKTNGNASRACALRMIIRYVWNACGVRETNGHGRGFTLYMRRSRKGKGFRRR